MPALGIISGIASIAGGIGENNRADSQQAAMEKQIALEAEKFGWTKEQAQAELTRRLRSAKNYWNDPANNTALTQDQATTAAENALNPLYNEQAKNAITDTSRGLMARGFYGQVPGDAQTLDALAKVENARAGAVGSMANQLYNDSQSRQLALKQLGLSTFGTYGDISGKSPKTSITETNPTVANPLARNLVGPGGTNPDLAPKPYNIITNPNSMGSSMGAGR